MGFNIGKLTSTFNKINTLSNDVVNIKNAASIGEKIGSSIDIKSAVSKIDLKNVSISDIKSLPDTISGVLENSEKNIQNQLEKSVTDSMGSITDTSGMESSLKDLASSGDFNYESINEGQIKEMLGNNFNIDGVDFF